MRHKRKYQRLGTWGMFLWLCHSLFNCPLKKTKILCFFDAIKLIILRFRLSSHRVNWQHALTQAYFVGSI